MTHHSPLFTCRSCGLKLYTWLAAAAARRNGCPTPGCESDRRRKMMREFREFKVVVDRLRATLPNVVLADHRLWIGS